MVLSSEPQRRTINMGRTVPFFVRDTHTQGFLGVGAITDRPLHNPFLDNMWGWTALDTSKRNPLKAKYINTIMLLRRCLPLYEFGDITGGKAIATLAASQEVMRTIETRYSYKVSVLIAHTLHGRASLYNRLKDYTDLGLDPRDNTAYYQCEVRKHAIPVLKGEKPEFGKFRLDRYADQVHYWRTRWGLPRAERLNITTLTPNPDRYRMSQMFSSGVRP